MKHSNPRNVLPGKQRKIDMGSGHRAPERGEGSSPFFPLAAKFTFLTKRNYPERIGKASMKLVDY
jgi:hypothetical protein